MIIEMLKIIMMVSKITILIFKVNTFLNKKNNLTLNSSKYKMFNNNNYNQVQNINKLLIIFLIAIINFLTKKNKDCYIAKVFKV